MDVHYYEDARSNHRARMVLGYREDRARIAIQIEQIWHSVELSAEEARRLAKDILTEFPEPKYEVRHTPVFALVWGVHETHSGACVAAFQDEDDALTYCEELNR